jgi:hypothetical protein
MTTATTNTVTVTGTTATTADPARGGRESFAACRARALARLQKPGRTVGVTRQAVAQIAPAPRVAVALR